MACMTRSLHRPHMLQGLFINLILIWRDLQYITLFNLTAWDSNIQLFKITCFSIDVTQTVSAMYICSFTCHQILFQTCFLFFLFVFYYFFLHQHYFLETSWKKGKFIYSHTSCATVLLDKNIWKVGYGFLRWYRGGSWGRVRGVHTPSWDEAFFFVYTYSLLNFFYLTVSDVIP